MPATLSYGLGGPSPGAGNRQEPAPSRIARVRRRVPYLVLGVLLVVLCVAGTVITMVRVADRKPVLSLARPVSVGHLLTSQDLQEVRVAMDSGTDVIPASEKQSVLGQPMAYSLPRGSLLPRSTLGQPQNLPPGSGIVAVAVKPGQAPPEIAPGMAVSVIPKSGARLFAPGPWSAVVAGVMFADQSTVVSLRLPIASARQIAEAPSGRLALVVVPAGRN
jgi:hypothetical protein